MIRRILHSHYFFVLFFPSFSSSSFFFFFLFVLLSISRRFPLPTESLQLVAGFFRTKRLFAVIHSNMICTLIFFKEYQKTDPFPCFLYIIDRANFKKNVFPNDTCFHNKIDRKKSFYAIILATLCITFINSGNKVRFLINFSSVSLVLSLSGLVLISKLLTSVNSFGPRPDKQVVVALNLCWWRASNEPTSHKASFSRLAWL